MRQASSGFVNSVTVLERGLVGAGDMQDLVQRVVGEVRFLVQA